MQQYHRGQPINLGSLQFLLHVQKHKVGTASSCGLCPTRVKMSLMEMSDQMESEPLRNDTLNQVEDHIAIPQNLVAKCVVDATAPMIQIDSGKQNQSSESS